MTAPVKPRTPWRAPAPAWGMAIIAGLGCALPLWLGLISGHSGFLWAALGAFQAARANPLHRVGMPRMMLLILLGAIGSGLGYWVAADPLLSVAIFALMGALLAWLQRFGVEAAKLGLGTLVCLCLGQGLQQSGDLSNPYAVSTLFCLGGLWLALLAFGLRATHGLRMWPQTPRLMNLLKALRRHARRLPKRQWRWHAVYCIASCALAGLIVCQADLSHGYWLTLGVLAPLQWALHDRLGRSLLTCLASVVVACLLIALGYSLQQPGWMVAIVLPLIVLSRGLQANDYAFFMLQSTACCLLLAESLSTDWDNWTSRLSSVALGFAVSSGLLLLIWIVRHHRALAREIQHSLRRLRKEHEKRPSEN